MCIVKIRRKHKQQFTLRISQVEYVWYMLHEATTREAITREAIKSASTGGLNCCYAIILSFVN